MMYKSQSWLRFAVALVAGLVVSLAILLSTVVVPALNARSDVKPTPTPTSTPIVSGASGDPVVARVDGVDIRYSDWKDAALLDRVMSAAAGQPAPTAEETLQRLVDERLILGMSSTGSEPSDQDVEERIAALEQAWQVEDVALSRTLRTVGLSRARLQEAVRRQLIVEAAVEAAGRDEAEWLMELQAGADVEVYDDRPALVLPTPIPEVAEAAVPAETSVPSPTATWTPTPTNSPTPVAGIQVPEQAPDFALDQSGGGTFNLAEQLAEGPVVLTFFRMGG